MHVIKPGLVIMLAIALTACGEDTVDEEREATAPTEAAAPVAPVTPAPAASAGGYEPNASERVPGITMSQEELDKLDKEARANMPAPVIPAE